MASCKQRRLLVNHGQQDPPPPFQTATSASSNALGRTAKLKKSCRIICRGQNGGKGSLQRQAALERVDGRCQTTVGRRWYLKSLGGEPHLQARQVQSAQGGDRRQRGKVRWQPRPAQAAGGARHDVQLVTQLDRMDGTAHSDESAGGAAATDRGDLHIDEA
jgi:hypothetical protein